MISSFQQVYAGCTCPECEKGIVTEQKPPNIWHDTNYVPILKMYCSNPSCDFNLKVHNSKADHYTGTVLICGDLYKKIYYSKDSLDNSAYRLIQNLFKDIKHLTSWSRTGYHFKNLLENKTLVCP